MKLSLLFAFASLSMIGCGPAFTTAADEATAVNGVADVAVDAPRNPGSGTGEDGGTVAVVVVEPDAAPPAHVVPDAAPPVHDFAPDAAPDAPPACKPVTEAYACVSYLCGRIVSDGCGGLILCPDCPDAAPAVNPGSASACNVATCAACAVGAAPCCTSNVVNDPAAGCGCSLAGICYAN